MVEYGTSRHAVEKHDPNDLFRPTFEDADACYLHLWSKRVGVSPVGPDEQKKDNTVSFLVWKFAISHFGHFCLF